MRRYRERKANMHPGGIALYRRVEELFDFGECHDLVEFLSNICAGHPENGAVEEDVFTPCKFWMKARTNLEKTGNAAVYCGSALGRLGDTREDLQQRRLDGAIATDDAE